MQPIAGLQTIHHKYPNGSTLSKFDYAYTAVGNILTWRQQADSTAVIWEYGYDLADQLVAATKKSTDPTPAVLTRYAYGYDPAANRTVEQVDDQVTGATYDSLNRLVTQQASGAMVFAGTISEPATVTVQGTPAVVAPDNQFRTSVPVESGTNAVTVAATDPSGNGATRQYEVDSFGSIRTFTYDANGNLTADGTRTFEWDARNQLVAVNVGTHRSEFTYDGQQRRIREIEKENGVAQSEIRLLWCGKDICEERAADGTTVTRRVYARGELVAGAPSFFTQDHLGNLREVVNGGGALLAQFAFDRWGRRMLVQGSDVTRGGFTGHRWEASASTWLTAYRQLDPDIGRWLTEDPLGLADGTNRYAYVQNNPINRFDPLGLKSYMCKKPLHAMGGKGKRSGPDVWGNPLYHQYYCVERNGVMTCCGQDRGGNPFLSAGKASQDSFDPETCSPLDTSPCQEDCLLKKCSSGRPRYGIGPQGTDCQEWSDDSVKDCKKCEQKK